MKLIDPNRLIQILLNPPVVNRRFDLRYLLEHQGEKETVDEDQKIVFQLFEIQASICRWRKMNRFVWFSLSFENKNELFQREIWHKNIINGKVENNVFF